MESQGGPRPVSAGFVTQDRGSGSGDGVSRNTLDILLSSKARRLRASKADAFALNRGGNDPPLGWRSRTRGLPARLSLGKPHPREGTA